jgi:hypothetical protein
MLAELSSFYRQICAKQVSKWMMMKLEKEITVLMYKMEKVSPSGWFNAMQHLLVHLPWKDRVEGPVPFRWRYSQERELKKLRSIVCNKARVEGCIVEAFMCKEIMNFSCMYFSCVNNMNTHTMRYHIVRDVSLSKQSIFQWKGKGVGAPSAHYITDKEWNYVIPDFVTKTEYSSYVCPGTILPHTQTNIVIIACQMSQIKYLLLHKCFLTKD